MWGGREETKGRTEADIKHNIRRMQKFVWTAQQNKQHVALNRNNKAWTAHSLMGGGGGGEVVRFNQVSVIEDIRSPPKW